MTRFILPAAITAALYCVAGPADAKAQVYVQPGQPAYVYPPPVYAPPPVVVTPPPLVEVVPPYYRPPIVVGPRIVVGPGWGYWHGRYEPWHRHR